MSSQELLISAIKEYTNLGYNVGLCKGKELLGKWKSDYTESNLPYSWDCISLILDDGLVCVDFDKKSYLGIPSGYDLPDTMVEETPNGLHFYYRTVNSGYTPRIKWQPHIDLLVSTPYKTSYGNSGVHFGNHALCAPSPGYKLLTKKIAKSVLTVCPHWLSTSFIYGDKYFDVIY